MSFYYIELITYRNSSDLKINKTIEETQQNSF